jgi:kynurenine formamidase
MTRLVDLSMPVHADMLTFPRVPPPSLLLYESWTDFAERIGAAQYGATSLTASYLVIQNDHVGTHCDAVKHIRGPEAPGVEGIPLEYCFSDGVRLDFRHKEKGTRIFPEEIDEALDKIGYKLKERDIVLIHTGAGAYNTEERYKTDFRRNDRRGDATSDRQGRADDGLRCDHVRSAGVGDVRAEALLGGAPRHERGRLLASREPDEP